MCYCDAPGTRVNDGSLVVVGEVGSNGCVTSLTGSTGRVSTDAGAGVIDSLVGGAAGVDDSSTGGGETDGDGAGGMMLSLSSTVSRRSLRFLFSSSSLIIFSS